MKAIFNYLWISGTHYNTAEGGADQNQMVLDVREGAVKIFHFAEFINEWPLKGRIMETRVKNCTLYIWKLSLIIYGFQISDL